MVGKSLTGAGRHGSKARNGKEERGLERILGRGLGRGFNLGAMHDVKGKRGRMQRERDKEKEKPPKQEGLELDGNQGRSDGHEIGLQASIIQKEHQVRGGQAESELLGTVLESFERGQKRGSGAACEITVWRRWTSVSLVAGRCGRSSSLHQGRQHEVRRSMLE